MRLLLMLPLVAAAVLAAGCESTFDKAAKARAEAGPVTGASALSMSQLKGVTATTEAILPSADGTTAAVVIEVMSANAGSHVLWAPIEVKLLDAAGKEVGTNNTPGMIASLVHLPSLDGGGTTLYVNDQIAISGKPATAAVTVGGVEVPGKGPGLLKTTPPTLTRDASLGDSWSTTVTNTTGVRQQTIIVQATVTEGGRIVGAGTANVDGLDPGASVDVTGFFVGSSSGKLEVFAPAANAPDGSGAPGAATSGGGGASS